MTEGNYMDEQRIIGSPTPSTLQQLQGWWKRPSTQNLAATVSFIAAGVLGALVITGATLRLKDIQAVAGVKIDATLLAKIGSYGVLALIMGKQFRDTGELQKQSTDLTLEQLQKERTSLAIVSVLAMLGAGTIVGITIGENLVKHRAFSMADFTNILIPLISLIQLAASSRKEAELELQEKEIVKFGNEEEQQVSVATLTTAEKVKKVANIGFAAVGILSLLGVGAAVAARYGFKIEDIKILGSTIPLNLKTFELLTISGGALAAIAIKNIALTRSQEELEKGGKGLSKDLKFDKHSKDVLAKERKKGMVRKGIGALLIGAGLIGIGFSIWSLAPESLKHVLNVNVTRDPFAVVIASLTALPFVASGLDLFAEEAINYEKVQKIAQSQQKSVGTIDIWYNEGNGEQSN
ncbi:MAG: hypothetical protein JSR80_04350 [Verrucomicrobia bacterium]|nr:hypothetical protein [Verrucomicrobiota bacterium]